MIATWLKVLLFVGGGATAAVGAAYVTGAFDPFSQDEAPVMASLPEPPARPLAEEEPASSPQAGELPVSAEGKVATQEAVDKDIVVPQFDLVRVEPDGSMVIAGRAEARATVEVVTGRDVIAAARAGPDGDFAAVLDEPLEPGDYQIVLRSTTVDNTVATSVQTAVVAVPDSPDGQVLALVDEPGVPAQLITVPEPQPADRPDEAEIAELQEGEEAPVARAETPDDAAETEMAEAEPAGEPDIAMAEPNAETRQVEAESAGGETLAAVDEPASSEPRTAELSEPTGVDDGDSEAREEIATEEPAAADAGEVAAAEEAPVTETAEVDRPEAPAEEEAVVAASETPTDEDVAVEPPAATADEELAVEAPMVAAEEEMAAESGEAEVTEESVAVAKPEAPAEQEIAALPEPSQPAPPVSEATAQPRVFVEAVEIDGGTVFVAGRAEAGRYVRVYANEILLGETRASQGDRFLIETRRDLPVGDYIIRADLLGSDGSVVARAAVPFEREPGEAIAAVAPPAAPAAAPAPEAGRSGETEVAEAARTSPEPDEQPAGRPEVAEQPAAPAAEETAEAETSGEEPASGAEPERVVAEAVRSSRAPEAEEATVQSAAPAMDGTPEAETETARQQGSAAPAVAAGEAVAEAEVPAVTEREPETAEASTPEPDRESSAVAGEPGGAPPETAETFTSEPERESAAVAVEPRAPPAEAGEDRTVAAIPTDEPVPADEPSESLTEVETPAPEADEVARQPVPEPDGQHETAMLGEPGVEETMSPALERVEGAVIIRRGDNLWRISRRVYGRGVRYSTIYLANQDQIRDPHWIWPGQVFTLPAQTEEGETADLEAIGDQAVDPAEVPGEIIR